MFHIKSLHATSLSELQKLKKKNFTHAWVQIILSNIFKVKETLECTVHTLRAQINSRAKQPCFSTICSGYNRSHKSQCNDTWFHVSLSPVLTLASGGLREFVERPPGHVSSVQLTRLKLIPGGQTSRKISPTVYCFIKTGHTDMVSLLSSVWSTQQRRLTLAVLTVRLNLPYRKCLRLIPIIQTLKL